MVLRKCGIRTRAVTGVLCLCCVAANPTLAQDGLLHQSAAVAVHVQRAYGDVAVGGAFSVALWRNADAGVGRRLELAMGGYPGLIDGQACPADGSRCSGRRRAGILASITPSLVIGRAGTVKREAYLLLGITGGMSNGWAAVGPDLGLGGPLGARALLELRGRWLYGPAGGILQVGTSLGWGIP